MKRRLLLLVVIALFAPWHAPLGAPAQDIPPRPGLKCSSALPPSAHTATFRPVGRFTDAQFAEALAVVDSRANLFFGYDCSIEVLDSRELVISWPAEDYYPSDADAVLHLLLSPGRVALVGVVVPTEDGRRAGAAGMIVELATADDMERVFRCNTDVAPQYHCILLFQGSDERLLDFVADNPTANVCVAIDGAVVVCVAASRVAEDHGVITLIDNRAKPILDPLISTYPVTGVLDLEFTAAG